jgi:hypothetical protein
LDAERVQSFSDGKIRPVSPCRQGAEPVLLGLRLDSVLDSGTVSLPHPATFSRLQQYTLRPSLAVTSPPMTDRRPPTSSRKVGSVILKKIVQNCSLQKNALSGRFFVQRLN